MQATTPELRPLSVGEVLDVAIKIFFRNAWPLFAIVLPIVAPVQFLSALAQISAEPDETTIGTSPTGELTIESGDIWLYVTAIAVGILLLFVASTLATGACFKAVGDAYLGERPTARGSLAFALRRVHSIVWVTVLTTVLAAIASLACIFPGIWLYVGFAVAVPALLMEGVRGTGALGRSWALVKGRWWATFGVVALGTLLGGIVSFAVSGMLEALALTDPDNEVVAIVFGTIGGTLASMVTTPFQAAFVTVLYFDLRVRKEGFDLQLLAERIGLSPPPEGVFRPAPAALPPQRTPGGEQPPYWPPPPGWKPSGGGAAAPATP